MEFVCVGLDIRMTKPHQPTSADATVWHQDEHLYKRAIDELKIKENPFQLLHPEKSSEISQLIDLVKSAQNAAVVALELPRRVFESIPYVNGIMSPLDISSYKWEHLGFDVCDINGFFSFLHMELIKEPAPVLFDLKNLDEAFVLAQAGNFVVPKHSPFVVVGIKRAKFDSH